MSDNFKYKLNIGGKILKKSIPYKKLNAVQKRIYDKIYDPINGPLEFAEHCCWVNCNGIVKYEPYDYQREMLFNCNSYNSVILLCSRQNGKCVLSNSKITIRNKKTGEIEEISIKDFFDMIKKSNKE